MSSLSSAVALTANFYLHEFTRSQTAARAGIDVHVEPGDPVYANLERLCRTVLQPLRSSFGPVHITSGYRPPKVNLMIGGSDRSQHCTGQAADFVVTGYSPYDVCRLIQDADMPVDQCIHEFGQWVHVSIAAVGREPRKEYLTAYKVKGNTRYRRGIHLIEDLQGVV